MPRLCISGARSRSILRTSRLYSSWQVTKLAAPRRAEVSSAADTWAAEKFEQPIARTLPSRTSSSSARRVSSIGTFGSGKWTW